MVPYLFCLALVAVVFARISNPSNLTILTYLTVVTGGCVANELLAAKESYLYFMVGGVLGLLGVFMLLKLPKVTEITQFCCDSLFLSVVLNLIGFLLWVNDISSGFYSSAFTLLYLVTLLEIVFKGGGNGKPATLRVVYPWDHILQCSHNISRRIQEGLKTAGG